MTPYLIKEFGKNLSYKIRRFDVLNKFMTWIFFRRKGFLVGADINIRKGNLAILYDPWASKDELLSIPLIDYTHEIIHLYQGEVLISRIKKRLLIPNDSALLKYRYWLEGLAEIFSYRIIANIWANADDLQYRQKLLRQIFERFYMIMTVLNSYGFCGYQEIGKIIKFCELPEEVGVDILVKCFNYKHFRYSKKDARLYVPYYMGAWSLMNFASKNNRSLMDLLNNPLKNKELKISK